MTKRKGLFSSLLTSKNARYAKRSFGITQTTDWHKPIDRLAYAPKTHGLTPLTSIIYLNK